VLGGLEGEPGLRLPLGDRPVGDLGHRADAGPLAERGAEAHPVAAEALDALYVGELGLVFGGGDERPHVRSRGVAYCE